MDGDVHVVEPGSEGHDRALAVRHAVFVEGQGVPANEEVDDHEPACTHFLAVDDDEAVGTARLRPLGDGRAKVERVAVVAPRRGEGWGTRLMDAVEAHAREAGVETLELHAQTHVEEFYADRGYEPTSGVFEEAGIDHVAMELALA